MKSESGRAKRTMRIFLLFCSIFQSDSPEFFGRNLDPAMIAYPRYTIAWRIYAKPMPIHGNFSCPSS